MDVIHLPAVKLEWIGTFHQKESEIEITDDGNYLVCSFDEKNKPRGLSCFPKNGYKDKYNLVIQRESKSENLPVTFEQLCEEVTEHNNCWENPKDKQNYRVFKCYCIPKETLDQALKQTSFKFCWDSNTRGTIYPTEKVRLDVFKKSKNYGIVKSLSELPWELCSFCLLESAIRPEATPHLDLDVNDAVNSLNHLFFECEDVDDAIEIRKVCQLLLNTPKESTFEEYAKKLSKNNINALIQAFSDFINITPVVDDAIEIAQLSKKLKFIAIK